MHDTQVLVFYYVLDIWRDVFKFLGIDFGEDKLEYDRFLREN